MADTRFLIAEFIKQGSISEDKIPDALSVTKLTPDGKAWFSFADRFLLVVGAVLLVSALTFFIAYNWGEVSKWAKFALVETFIALSVLAYWKLGVRQLSAKIALLAASLLLGVLLALYGQTYQTGADPWQLFFYWVLLILPWVLLSQFATLWIVFLFLLNLSLVLYVGTFGGLFGFSFSYELHFFWLLFALNGVALLVWEYMSLSRVWLQATWATRLLACVSGASMTVLVVGSFDFSGNYSVFPVLTWLIYLSALYFYYRKKKPDLFMLAGGCLSVSVVILTRMFHTIETEGGIFVLILLILGLGSVCSIWLKKVQQEMQS